MAKLTPYRYGQSKTPTTWHETADAIRGNHQKPTPKQSKSEGHLETIAKLLKDRK